MPNELLLILVGAAAAGFVQGLSGFAFGMVSMSLWVWWLEPRLIAVLVVFGSLTGQGIAALAERSRAPWSALAPYLLGGVIGIPLGVLLLPALDPNLFKLLLGLILTVWCPVMLLAGRMPRLQRGGRVADGLAGAAGGFMGGLGGLTAVIPTLWCTLRGLDKDEQRSIIQRFNLVTLGITMAAYLASGVIDNHTASLLPAVALALLLPHLLGARLYRHLSQQRFRQIVLALLSLSGLAMLLAAIAARVA
ncbi:sulfite exporter TauE/SafE family protein [Chitinolyticbacter meiyuanensis]|uniref:sulfite exporter TauE/SafE family protein n=1 Tax=Chitinolyticbacter meiyuanensis TaxID=682798 RepID=UPI0011E5A21B|nr:sulfite exporter TauE/SafE family protein [Chitinolyticbacter meiyuanensis]